MHNVYKVVTLQENEINSVLLLEYLFTCDHFVKVCINGLNNKHSFAVNSNSAYIPVRRRDSDQHGRRSPFQKMSRRSCQMSDPRPSIL